MTATTFSATARPDVTSLRWSHLRRLPTSFVGRKAELAALASSIERSQLVTLLGPPGVGKTRLAKEYALSIVGSPWPSPPRAAPAGDAIEGGVFFCDLSDAESEEQAVFRLQQTLDLARNEDARGGLRSLLAALDREAPALVVLDNFEQLVRSSRALVSALVAANDRTRWLITARERLAIAEEALFDLAPLSLAAPSPGTDAAQGTVDSEALALFMERARAVAFDVALSETDRRDAAELVRQLDGLPLAIELAAARTRILRPRQITERLHERFSLLTTDSSALGRGGATLFESMEASWRLLHDDERSVLQMLSVFRGGFDVEAAEFVVGPREDAKPTLDSLQSLRDKSLVTLDDTEPSHRRLTLLVSIREFAHARLPEAERLAGERRHAEHYLRLAERLGRDDTTSHRRFALEHENVLAVHQRFLEAPHRAAQPDVPLRAALALTEGRSKLPYALGLRLLDAALDLALEAAEPLVARDWLARGLAARGDLRRFVGLTDDSIEDFSRLREIGEADGAPAITAAALMGLGNAATVRARWSDARVLFERALDIHTAARDRRSEGRALAMLAATLFNEDEPERAREVLLRALARAREARDRFFEGVGTTSLGIVALALGDVPEARTCLSEGLRLHREGGARHWEGVTLSYLAKVEHEAGRAAEAHEHYATSVALLREIEVARAEGLARFGRGCLLLAEDRLQEARAELGTALDLCRTMAPDHEGLVLGALGAVTAREGDRMAAQDLFEYARRSLQAYPRATFLAAVDVYAGLLDVLEPGNVSRAKHRAMEQLVEQRLRAVAGSAARSFEVRLAGRELERTLVALAARGATAARTLVVGPLGAWFRPPRAKTSVQLSRRRALQHIVHELALHRTSSPGEAISIARLVAVGWPGERVLPEAGAERVYTAIATLRKLGLRGLLVQMDDGYLLDPTLEMVRSV